MKLNKNNLYYKNLYKYIDGVYTSYWLGKFINSFIKNGNKKTIEKELKKVYIYSKLHNNLTILPIFLECVEKIKPIVKLNSVMVAGKAKEYPVLLDHYKQRTKAIYNIKTIIKNRKDWFLNQRILNEFLDFKKNKNHLLVKQRNEDIKIAVANRFNTRFAKRRR